MSYDPLAEAINAQIIDYFLQLDDRGNFTCAPKNDDELDLFIRAAFGVTLSKKVITPGHRAPFDFLADLFFERTRNALAFANRAGGKTFSVAMLNFLDMLFKPCCEIASAGAVKDQAEKAYRYFLEFCQLPWFQRFNERYARVTGRPFFIEKESIKTRTVFGNKSRMEIITASENGLRGQHPQKFRLDEVDLIDWSLLQTALSQAKSERGIKAQNVFTSTRQNIDGSMDRLLNEAHEKGISIYEWNIWESVQKCPYRCKSDPEHGDCPIFTFCRGKAHHCDGFYYIDDFIDKVRVLDRGAFEVEWLNLRPARHKQVYHMFGTKHIMTPEKLYAYAGFTYPQATWHRVSGLDFGSSPGHPFVYLKFCQIPNKNSWLLFFEYVAEQRLLKDHAIAIRNSPYYLKSEIIYADHAAQERLELKALGIRTKAATKGAGSVKIGIDHIGSLLSGYPPKEEPMLYVWHECHFTIKEWQKYSWPVLANGKVDRSGNPEKVNDHSSDAARMALVSHKKFSGTKYHGSNVPGI